MGYDLVCASCSGLVEDGRCPTCRASRQRLREQQRVHFPATAFLIAAAVVALLTLVLH